MAHYERLSALDAPFLEIEDVGTHMHVAAALVFDAAPLRCAHGGVDMERIRAYIGSRLHLVPRYRQRLAYVPIERHPVWIAYPMVPLFANQALGFALFSYAGNLYWGLNADWDALPDLHDLAAALHTEFEVLRDAAGLPDSIRTSVA